MLLNASIAAGDSIRFRASIRNRKTGAHQNLTDYVIACFAILKGVGGAADFGITATVTLQSPPTHVVVEFDRADTWKPGVYVVELTAVNVAANDEHTLFGTLEIKGHNRVDKLADPINLSGVLDAAATAIAA